jgi:hypothetical protein
MKCSSAVKAMLDRETGSADAALSGHLSRCGGCRSVRDVAGLLDRAGEVSRMRDMSPVKQAQTREQVRGVLQARGAVRVAHRVFAPGLVYGATFALLLLVGGWMVYLQWSAPQAADPAGGIRYEVQADNLEYGLVSSMNRFRQRYVDAVDLGGFDGDASALRYRLAVASAGIRAELRGLH